MRKTLVFISFIFLITQFAFGQCFNLEGVSPAFEFNIANGVTITSVKVTISNYSHGGEHYKARIRSFSDLETVYVDADGVYEVLNAPIAGPNAQDLQLESGVDPFCGHIGDFVKFNWLVEIKATGTNGTLINYSGALTDNLAIPTNIGSVHNGTNKVSGSLDLKLTGTGVELYVDMDYDGFGDPSQPTIIACTDACQVGYSTNKLDCNDYDPSANPGASEIPYNGKDDDCNYQTPDDDLDNDGFAIAYDCDDLNADINPGNKEIPFNDIDDDCNPSTTDFDLDGDGYQTDIDCDDHNANINPGKTEIQYNGIDDDCDVTTPDDDLDTDGFAKANDCDDSNALINPGKSDIPNNGIDEDCDGSDHIVAEVGIYSDDLKIYPNPASAFIYVELQVSHQLYIELFDMTGSRVLTANGQSKINVETLVEGAYFVKIKIGNAKQIVRKIIVARQLR